MKEYFAEFDSGYETHGEMETFYISYLKLKIQFREFALLFRLIFRILDENDNVFIRFFVVEFKF